MTEKPKPPKPVLPPIHYPESLGKRIGNKLFGWLTPWLK